MYFVNYQDQPILTQENILLNYAHLPSFENPTINYVNFNFIQ